jgi:hypothetical protein
MRSEIDREFGALSRSRWGGEAGDVKKLPRNLSGGD